MMYLALIDYGHGEVMFRHYHGTYEQVCALAQEWADDDPIDTVELYELVPDVANDVAQNLVGKFHQSFQPVLVGDPRLSRFFLFGYDGEVEDHE